MGLSRSGAYGNAVAACGGSNLCAQVTDSTPWLIVEASLDICVTRRDRLMGD